MTLHRSTLASALAMAFALGAAGSAHADIYAGSSLAIERLTVAFLDANNNDASASVTIKNFNFSLTNTALINGVGGMNGLFGGNCSGTEAANSCGVSPTLNALAANAQGSAFNRADNDFTMFGIGGGNWSNSDSVIRQSELTDGVPTKTDQIAEANITSVQSAQSSALINSTTGLTFTASVGPGVTKFFIEFWADPDMMAKITNDLGAAQSTMATSVDFSKDGAFTGAKWTMDGVASGASCQTNLTCTELFDGANLNQTIGVTTNNTEATNAPFYNPNAATWERFSILVDGVTAGEWTLLLSATTSTNLSRQIPEPGALALTGLALAGLGLASRRRKV